MFRHASPCFLIWATLALSANAAAAAPASHPDFTGLWLITTGEKRVVPKAVEGLLTPYAKARMDARNAQIAAGFPRIEAHLRCEPAGMPQMMSAPFAIQIMQNADRIMLDAEISNLPRTIFFRKSQPDDVDPTWNGHSIAHWQGKALVIDTVGLNDGDALDFNFDPTVFRTETLHVTEVWTLGDGGKMLADQMTLDDPKTFTQPVTVTYRYAKRPKDEGYMEKVCDVDAQALVAFEKAYPRTPKYKHPF
jgi:hypothetical protein